MALHIQYLGFELKPRGRVYSYRVVDTKSEAREFTLTISNQAFVESNVPYQDAASLCYQKLQKEQVVVAKREGKIRVSPHLFNSERDIDRLINVVAA